MVSSQDFNARDRPSPAADSCTVVVEKPFTTTSAEADALIATSKETGKLLTVFQNRRYDSDFRTLQRVISSGCLGEITEFQNHYDMDNPEWVRGWTSKQEVPGEGMLYGLGTHSLDQTLLLFGKPASVTAFTRALRQKDVHSDDSFTVVLQYDGEKSNLVCTVKTTIVSTLPMERQLKFMVRGRDGTFLKVRLSPSQQRRRRRRSHTHTLCHRVAKTRKSTSCSPASRLTTHVMAWSLRNTMANSLPRRKSITRRSRLVGCGEASTPALKARTWTTTRTSLLRSGERRKLW